MARGEVKSMSKSRKHHRKDASSSEAEESSSDQDSPRSNRKKSRKEKQTLPVHMNEKEKSGKHKKRPERRDSSESPGEDASPPKRRKNDEDKSHKKHQHQESHSKVRGDEERNDNRHNSRNHRREPKIKQAQSSNVKVKNEEDFDRRQEEIRRKRRRENEHRERSPHRNVKIKQERISDDEGNRSRKDRMVGRPRRRNDIERERRENDARRAEAWQKREREGGQNAEALLEDNAEPKEKEKPNLGLSGALTEDTNSFRGVVIKYSEPPEARVPTKKWRLYPFKGDEALKVLHMHRQSAYLLGKLRRIADIPIDHPSCSKQHAVFQFRMVEGERQDGTKKRVIKPYIIDLDSANGTFVNNQKIQPRRYVELKEKDVLKFAFSSREYVLIHDKSDTTEVDVSGEESDDED